jgi:formyl-CoA transferase
LELFLKAGLPCGPINTIPEVFDHPQIQARDLVLESVHPSAGKISLTGFPYKLTRTPPEIHQSPPRLGEHNQHILVDLLGYSMEDLSAYTKDGVI